MTDFTNAPFTNVVNLTPHEVTIYLDGEAEAITIPPAPISARVAVSRKAAGCLNQPGGIPTAHATIWVATYGEIEGLPDPAPNTAYLVSLMVAERAWAQGRTDVFAPGELRRDAAGQPVGCNGVTGNPALAVESGAH